MKRVFASFCLIIAVCFIHLPPRHAAELGEFTYDDFSNPKQCSMCHREIYQEWQQSLMSQSFTHPWDDIEFCSMLLYYP